MLDYLLGNLSLITRLSKIDLDTIIKPGKYDGVWEHGCINTPNPLYIGEFYLEVIKVGPYKVQICINCSYEIEIYIRGWIYNENKFGKWRKITLSVL